MEKTQDGETQTELYGIWAGREDDFPWRDYLHKEDVPERVKREICNRMITTDPQMESLFVKHYTVEDYHAVWKHKAGKGMIGGKACGLLMIHKLTKKKLPQYAEHMAEHESCFIGSDVFYQYTKMNGCLELRENYKDDQKIAEGAPVIRDRLRSGQFSEEMRVGFRRILKYFEGTPVIVRSSSLLEDGFGNSFSGKYESIYCRNDGSEEERLQQFEESIREIYASTMSEAAIEYRRKRGLLDADEEMALLVQKVVGQKYGDYYMPIAAGMGCSYNPYRWLEHMNPNAGMLRMVVGLGTRAVERTPGDYPRLISLDRAQANARSTVEERHKFSQRKVDLVDVNNGCLVTKDLRNVIPELTPWRKKLVLSHDTEAEERLQQRGAYREVLFADCQGLANDSEFIDMMRRSLKMLEAEYGRTVEIEFAITSPEKGKYFVNFLQCRPSQNQPSQDVKIPVTEKDEILFDITRTSMRRSKVEKLDRIVWVDPQKYYEYDFYKKPSVAKAIGEINQHYLKNKIQAMLLVPGRIGTSSPELGVPVSYADISQFIAICEVAYSKAGYNPELSYGSHMFQDMVEADVYYGAINNNRYTKCYQPEILPQFSEVYEKFCADNKELAEIIKIYDVSACDARLFLNASEGRAFCRLAAPGM